MKTKVFALLAGFACGWLAGCTPPPPSPVVTAQPPAVYATSFICADGNTPVQNAVCANQQLAVLDMRMAGVFRRHLAQASLFGRDQLLANQRAWLLALPAQCKITTAAAGATQNTCLANAYTAQITMLTNWPTPPAGAGGVPSPISRYVTYTLLDAKEPSVCGMVVAHSTAAMSNDGSLDPGLLPGAQEIAGSHGGPSGTLPGGGVANVALYQAGLYGDYQTRAQNVTVGGAILLAPDSLGKYVETLPNGGGRFVSFASQTNDYGTIDVFTLNGQNMALVTDVIGYQSPAPPGESAVAGLFTLTPGGAAPACLFETFLMPPPIGLGVFSEQRSLTPLLILVDSIHGAAPDGLAPSDRQDSSAFAHETRWTMLNMPLIGLAQAAQGGWVSWLRQRHDDVLDTLDGWARRSPQNQAQFQQLFALLRPAAADLETIYVQRQGLKAADAEQATALAMMELLYQATTYIAPGIGGTPQDPAMAQGYQPRYPILANPN